MADFNIGILSTLDVDSSSSQQSINKTLKDIEKNINNINVGLEVNQNKGTAETARKSANSVVDTVNKSSQLKKIKVDLDVNITQSKSNIRKAISKISNDMAKQKVKVNIEANVDTASAKNAGKTLSNAAQMGADLKNSLGSSSTLSDGQEKSKLQNLKATVVDLGKSYQNVGALKSEISKITNANLRSEVKQIKDADGALKAYRVTLQQVSNTGKALTKHNYDFKPNDDGSLSLQKITDLNSIDKARKQTHDQIVKSIQSEIAAIDKLNAKAKLTTDQADLLKSKYAELSRFKNAGGILESDQFNRVKNDVNGTLKAFEEQNLALQHQKAIQKDIAKEIDRINKLNTQGKINSSQSKEIQGQLQHLAKMSKVSFIDPQQFEKAKSEVNRLTSEYLNQNKLLRQQESIMAQIERSERRLADSINKRATGQLKKELTGLNSGGLFGKDAAYQMNNIQGQIRTITAEAERATRSQMGFVESFRQAMVKFPIWMGASTLFFGAIQSGKTFLSIITDIDSKMITLAKVMGDDADLESVFNRANDAALQFGQTISGVLDAYAEFARQGYNENDTAMFGNAALIASNVGEIDAKQAAEYLTSMSAQWETQAHDAMRQVDSLNQISNEYATTVEKLAQGQAKAGSTAKSMGLTFDETNAIIGSLTAKTKQSGDEIGNFMKAVLPKLYVGTGKKTIEGLGIDMKDSNGNLKSAITLLEEVSQKIKGIDKDQQAAIIRGLGGTYHYQRMQVLLDDLGKADSLYKQIKNTSENSAGSAIAENQKYLESVEAKINKAKVAVEQFALALGDAFVKAGMLDGLRMVTNLLTGITQALQSLGTTAPLLGALGGVVSLFSKNVRSGFETARLSIADFITQANDLKRVRQNIDGISQVTAIQGAKGKFADNQTGAASSLVFDGAGKYDQAASKAQAATTSTIALSKAQKDLSISSLLASNALTASNIKMTATTAVSRAATAALAGLKMAFRGLMAATGVGLVITGISFALEKMIGSANKASTAVENFKMQQDTLKQSIESMGGTTQIKQLVDDYDMLQQKMSSGKSFNTEEAQKYKDTVSQLKNIFPDLSSKEGQYGTVLNANSNVLRQRIDLMQQQMQIEKEQLEIKKQQEAVEAAKNAREQADKLQTGGFWKPNMENELHAKSLTVSATMGGEDGALDKKILQVKSLTDAQNVLKQVTERAQQAERDGHTKEASQWNKKKQYLQEYINKKNEVAMLERVQIDAEATKFNTHINNMKMKNYELGASGQSVMQTLSMSVQGMITSGKQAETVFNQFTTSLAQDKGFITKMQSYENALNKFKNAKTEAERSDRLPQLEAAYSKVSSAILDAARSANMSKSEINQLKQSLEGNIEAETGYNAEVTKGGKVTLDLTKKMKQNSGAVDENSQAKMDNAEATDAMKEANEEAANAMQDAANKQEILGKALGELDAGNLGWDTKTDLVREYGKEAEQAMLNEASMRDFLMAKSEEEKEKYIADQQEKYATSEEFYQKVAGKGTELQQHMMKQYGIDTTNYADMKSLQEGINKIYNEGTAEQQEKLVNGIADSYGIDLSNFGTLGEKKNALENQLMQALGEKWNKYILAIAETTENLFSGLKDSPLGKIPGFDNFADGLTSRVQSAAQKLQINASQLILDKDDKWKKYADIKTGANGGIGQGLEDIKNKAYGAARGMDGLGRSGSGAGKGLDRAKKSMDSASKEAEKLNQEAEAAGISVEKLYKTFTVTTYVADELQMALDKVNHQLEKQKLNTQKYATWSQKYRDSLKAENKLIDEKTRKLNEQIKSMQDQIAAGQVIEYGLVDSSVDVPYYRYSANGLSGGEYGSVSGLSGSSNQAKVWNYLKARGLSDHAVAGIMGNIERESRFNPAAKEQGGTGIGLAQWSFGRANNLKNFAKRKGKAWSDLNTQLDFLWHELTTTETNALRALKSSRSVIAAADAFQRKFERAGVVAQGQRNSAAKKYYNQFKGTGGNSVVKGMAGKSVVADPTAYLFDSTFGRYTKGGLSGAHYGLDLTSGNINNSQIRAAKTGVVTFKGWTGGGNTISIFDGKNTYTYMHMIRPSKLKVGDAVQAGQHVGNVGSTYGRGGRSTGPHLHVQVNKGRTPTGTFMDTFKGAHAAIDPRLGGYLKVAGGGSIDFNNLSTGAMATGSINAAMADDLNRIQEERLAEIEAAINEHNEAEKMKQKVDELRKKLMDTQLEAIRNSQAKRENLYNIHKSHIESFDRSRELQAAKSAKYEYQLNKIEFEKGRNTAAWRKKNEELQISKELEQKWEQDKITYINKALKSNKDGIFGSQTVYRDEMEKAKREAEQNIRDISSGVMRARGEIAASLVDQIIDDYNDDVDKLQRIIDGYAKQKSHLDAMDMNQAAELVRLTTEQHKEAKKRADTTQFYISQLEEQSKKIGKNAELQKRIKSQLNEMKTAYDDAALSAHEFLKEAADIDIERQLTVNSRRLKEFQKDLRKSEYNGAFISSEYQIDLFRDNQEKLIKGYAKEQEALRKNKKELEEMLKLYKSLPSQSQKIKDSIEEITNSLDESNKALHTVRSEMASAMIQSIKTIYQKQLEVATKAYDDEYKEFEKMINKKMRLLDDESKEETFQKDVKDKTEALNKIREEIANRMGDDSLANQKKLKDLREQLLKGEEEYEMYLRNKNREDKKQALQDELQDKNEQLQQQKEDLNKAFTDLLEDTRKFNEIQEDIMKGQVDKYKDLVTDLSKFVSDNMKDIGNSIGQNILDAIGETFKNLVDVANLLSENDKNGNIPLPTSSLKPKPLSEATAAAIKQLNAIAPNAILNGLNIKDVMKPKDINKAVSNITTNNNTQAKALVNIENFNGSQKEVDNLVSNLETALRKSGTL